MLTTTAVTSLTNNKNGQLPPGWQVVRFEQMAENITDRVDNPAEAGVERYVGLEHLDPESLKIKRWGTPDEVEATKLRFQPGDIIFGKRRFYQRKLAVADFEGICSAHALVLRAREDVVVKDFLPFFMQSEIFFERAMSISVGSLSPTINWKTLAVQEFAIPPKEEQQRIAEILWATDEAIESLKKVKLATKELQVRFSNHLFELDKMSDSDSGIVKGLNNKIIPLGSVCSLQSGFPFKSAKFVKSGDRLLRCSNVGIERLQWKIDDTVYWPTNRRDEVSSYVLKVDDIVIAMDRPFISEGFKVARITEDDLPALLVQRVGRFLPTSKIDPNYLWAFLHSSAFQRHLKNSQQGTDLPHISKFDIESAPLVLPSIEDQRQWSYRLQQLEIAIFDTEIDLLRSIDLKKKLLVQVF